MSSKDTISLVPEYALGVEPRLFRDAVIHITEEVFLFAVGSYICTYDLSKQQTTFPIKIRGQVTCIARYAVGNVNLVAVGLKREQATQDKTEQAVIQVFNLGKEGVSAKTLTGKFGNEVELLCFPGPQHLCSIGKNQVLQYWKWESEKALASFEVKTPISRIMLHPKSNSISMSGKSYLRLIEINAEDGALKESETFLSLKEEKRLHFLDQCWIGKGTHFIAITADSLYFFHHIDLTETIPLKKIVQEAEGDSPVPRRIPEKLALTCCTTWAKGFVLGGTHGFLGVFAFNKSGGHECIGTFWMEDPYTISYISSQTGDAPMALLCNKQEDDDLFAGISSFARPKHPNWYFYTFPVSQCDLLAAQVNFEQVFPLGFHQESITHMSCAVGRQCFVTCSEDNTLKVCTYDLWLNVV